MRHKKKKNIPLHKKRKRTLARKLYMLRIKARIHDIFSSGCIDCGETDICTLQFDHVRGEKVMNVARLVSAKYGWASIEREIAKCEVVCANCHARRSAKTFGWYSWKNDA